MEAVLAKIPGHQAKMVPGAIELTSGAMALER